MNGPTGRLSWRAKTLLIASLTLNGFLAAEMLWRPVPDSFRPHKALPLAALTRTLASLPPTDAVLVTEAIDRRRGVLDSADARYREASARALRCLAADQLDLPAFRQAVADARLARQQAVDEALGAVYETLPQLSVETRRALVAGGGQLARAR